MTALSIGLSFDDTKHSLVQIASLKPPPHPEPDPEEPPPPPDFPSKILDLAPEGIRTIFGTETLIDVGSNATIESGTSPLKGLRVHLPGELNWFDHIGLQENSHVAASDGINPGSVITVDGVEIGTISTSSDQWATIFNFNANATPERVQQLIRSLTYTNTSTSYDAYSGNIELILSDTHGESWSEYANVVVASEGLMVLTQGADYFAGREGDDEFYAFKEGLSPGDVIVGGEGFDTLTLLGGNMFFLSNLAGLIGIEKIQGTREEDSIAITPGQLAAVQILDGGTDPSIGKDFLQLTGSYFDLTGKEILNFAEINLVTEGATVVVDAVDMAKLVHGRDRQGETLILSQGTLTEAERLQIHRQGIDTIITLADGTTTKHKPPKVTDLDGDHVTLNAPKVLIDAGQSVKIESDDGLMGYLNIGVFGGDANTSTVPVEREDILEIETSDRIELSDGLRAKSRVIVGGIDIGAIGEDYAPAFSRYLPFTFNENAAPELVEELVRAITYRSANGRIFESKQIQLSFGDSGYRESQLQTVSIDPETQVAPTDIQLSATTIAEFSRNGSVIGDLTASDANFGETFTYTLTNDAGGRFAIVDDKLVVKHGVKLDFEQARSHVITIKVTDAVGLSFEKTVTIHVSDVNPEMANGTSGHDKIVGGAGRDMLSGAAGADTLVGGRGDDVLTGGTGCDSLTGGDGKDLFVFLRGDTGVGSTHRDVITDFRHGVDRIDLSRIDANTATRTDNRFSELLDAGKAFGKAGQLRYDASTGILSGNTDGDSQAEFQIMLRNKPAALTLSDFVL